MLWQYKNSIFSQFYVNRSIPEIHRWTGSDVGEIARIPRALSAFDFLISPSRPPVAIKKQETVYTMTDYRSLSPADVVAMVTKTASHEEFQIKSISLPSKSRTTLHFSNKLSNKQQHHDECSVTEAETDFSESFCASLENIHSAGDEDDSIFGPYDNEDDPTQSSFSEGEEEEAQEILAPANILPIPSSPPIQQRRKNKCRASRFPSVKLAPSLNDLEEKRDNEESEQTR